MRLEILQEAHLKRRAIVALEPYLMIVDKDDPLKINHGASTYLPAFCQLIQLVIRNVDGLRVI